MANRSTAMRVGLAVILVVLIVAAYFTRQSLDAAAIERWVQDLGVFGPVVFVILYAVATVLFLPGAVVTLVGGVLFGPILGTLYNLTGATLGATVAFLITRHLAADWIATKAGRGTKRLIQGVEAEGWRFVAFVRLVPFFPFNLLNYALGLTRIKTLHYVAASFVFMLPGAIAYTYLGYAGRELASGAEGTIQKVLLAIALISSVAFLPRIVGRIRRGPTLSVTTLKQSLDSETDVTVLDVRTTKEFFGNDGHIAGALNIPIDDLPARMGELDDRLEQPIALICRTDRRSSRAARLLARQGFADVHVIEGGMTAWNASGLPVVHERPTEG